MATLGRHSLVTCAHLDAAHWRRAVCLKSDTQRKTGCRRKAHLADDRRTLESRVSPIRLASTATDRPTTDWQRGTMVDREGVSTSAVRRSAAQLNVVVVVVVVERQLRPPRRSGQLSLCAREFSANFEQRTSNATRRPNSSPTNRVLCSSAVAGELGVTWAGWEQLCDLRRFRLSWIVRAN